MLEFDDKIVSRLFGYSGMDEYYDKSSCIHVVHQIKVPTLFLNALDDPIIRGCYLDINKFKSNPNLILGTTQYGGHMAYNEHFLTLDSWLILPIFKFLDSF